MAAIWKGAINFGLINVPVKLLSATDKESVAFRTLHKKCGTPINQKRFCPVCGNDVEYKDTVKGYEYEKGEFVEITEDDLKKIPLKSAKYIQIIDFINLSAVDPIYFEKSYYLAPEPAGEKPYLILYNAMKQTNSAAVSKISIRDKERLCSVRVYEDGLMLNTMFFPAEIKPYTEAGAEKIALKTNVLKAETDMAAQIVKNLTSDFKPEKYHDEYYEQFLKIVEAKAEGKTISSKKSEKSETKDSMDLFEKLKMSLEASMKNNPAVKKSTNSKKDNSATSEKSKNNKTKAPDKDKVKIPPPSKQPGRHSYLN